MKIMVIGTETKGNSITKELISNGHDVILRDDSYESIESSVIAITKSLEENVVNKKLKEKEKNEILKKLSATINLNEAMDCDLVIDTTVNDLKTKKQLFKKLDYICKKQTILITTTSSLSIKDISLSTNRPDRVIGIYFSSSNPCIKSIKVIDGMFTSEETHRIIFNLSNNI